MVTSTAPSVGAGRVGAVLGGRDRSTGRSTKSSAEVAPEEKVVIAALRCCARWGHTKTTLDDVAREAGISRATVYRLFPGGKAPLMEAMVRHEVSRLMRAVSAATNSARGLEDFLGRGMVATAEFVSDHEALQYLLAHEPEVILPHLAFDRLKPLFSTAAAFLVPRLRRFVDEQTAEELSEWVVRLVMSYIFVPSPSIDLRDEYDARRLVRSFVLPGVEKAARCSSGASPIQMGAH
ncbi:MAG: hypothetical protein JJLCMIEE_02229 [Acidimicrobiales bacterium]|nr:MAG: TetR/AcrR family transcriptional regulator [Actinomycetota bacterium]MBV6509161.1 hypothetical protein [Acidimicrobiales bacterium]RIK08492.1 MAG: hypothetical protein DCC48_00645 [Acidobacteriota bacterium]